MRTNSLRIAAAAALMSFVAGMPALGQRTQIAVRPGSGLILKRDRGYRHKPRELDPVARAKHTAKMRRRYQRWAWGVLSNRCVNFTERLRQIGVNE